MDFIRKVVNGTDLKDFIDIPTSLVNKKVEIIIFPVEEDKKKNKKRKSLSGYLAQYAKANMLNEEENAWYEEAKE